MNALLEAILDDDRTSVEALLRAAPTLATRPIDRAKFYDSKILHWIYVGDTALHLAALREHGACAQHRCSFGPVRDVLRR